MAVVLFTDARSYAGYRVVYAVDAKLIAAG
jgi:hypothetical protein